MPVQLTPRTAYEMMTVMRYTSEHKGRVRARIVRAAAGSLRTHGLDEPSVPSLMKKAGLTHGGFYVHFRDRDELVAEAVRTAARDTAETVFTAAPDLAGMLDRYLSEEHLRKAESGCVVAALGTDGWRKSPRVRAAFAEAALGLARLVDGKLRERTRDAPISDRALAVTAQMIGSVVLGRLLADPELARRALRAGRQAALRN